MRSRAVILPLACCFSTARSEPGVHRLVVAALQVGQLAGRGVRIGLGRSSLATGSAAMAPEPNPGRPRARSGGDRSRGRYASVRRGPTARLDVGRACAPAARPAAGPGSTWSSETASTNADLLARPTVGAGPRPCCVAEHQTAGRGRLDRVWTSPPRRRADVLGRWSARACRSRRWGWLPLLAGVALAEAVQCRRPGSPPALKWPNDLLAGPDGRKAGRHPGPDAPTATPSSSAIGLNVSTTARRAAGADRDLAGRSRAPATSTATALLVAILRPPRRAGRAVGGRRRRRRGLRAGRRLPRGLRHARHAGAGDRRPTAPRATGLVTGIDADGRLLLDVDGTRTTVGAGDVEHLRAGVTSPARAAAGTG